MYWIYFLCCCCLSAFFLFLSSYFDGFKSVGSNPWKFYQLFMMKTFFNQNHSRFPPEIICLWRPIGVWKQRPKICCCFSENLAVDHFAFAAVPSADKFSNKQQSLVHRKRIKTFFLLLRSRTFCLKLLLLLPTDFPTYRRERQRHHRHLRRRRRSHG